MTVLLLFPSKGLEQRCHVEQRVAGGLGQILLFLKCAAFMGFWFSTVSQSLSFHCTNIISMQKADAKANTLPLKSVSLFCALFSALLEDLRGSQVSPPLSHSVAPFCSSWYFQCSLAVTPTFHPNPPVKTSNDLCSNQTQGTPAAFRVDLYNNIILWHSLPFSVTGHLQHSFPFSL